MRSIRTRPTADRVQLREPLEGALNTHRGIVSRTDRRTSPGGRVALTANERRYGPPARTSPRRPTANGIGNTGASRRTGCVCWNAERSAAPRMASPCSAVGLVERQTVPISDAQRRGDHKVPAYEQPDRRPDRLLAAGRHRLQRAADSNRLVNGTTRLRDHVRPASRRATLRHRTQGCRPGREQKKSPSGSPVDSVTGARARTTTREPRRDRSAAQPSRGAAARRASMASTSRRGLERMRRQGSGAGRTPSRRQRLRLSAAVARHPIPPSAASAQSVPLYCVLDVAGTTDSRHRAALP